MAAASKDPDSPLGRAPTPRPSPRVVLRYLLFQVPEWGAFVAAAALGSRWLDLPLWIWIAVPLAWVLKDLLLFPFVWQAYSTEPSRLVGEGALLGARGVAVSCLAPHGYIRVGSELWRAELETGESPVPEGAWVHISGIQGLTLRVRPRPETLGEERRP